MLYWLEHDTSHKFKYACKDQSLQGWERHICPSCGREIATPIYTEPAPHLVLEGGRQFPDLLQFCGAGERWCLISEKALTVLEEAKLSGFDGYKQCRIESRSKVTPPEYYCLNITGQVDFDFAAMFLKKKKSCDECGQFSWNRTRMHPRFIDRSTWDSSDICRLKSIPGFIVCSQRFAETVMEYHLSGFAFSEARYNNPQQEA